MCIYKQYNLRNHFLSIFLLHYHKTIFLLDAAIFYQYFSFPHLDITSSRGKNNYKGYTMDLYYDNTLKE